MSLPCISHKLVGELMNFDCTFILYWNKLLFKLTPLPILCETTTDARIGLLPGGLVNQNIAGFVEEGKEIGL